VALDPFRAGVVREVGLGGSIAMLLILSSCFEVGYSAPCRG
jgi:hypothetical protein